MDITENGTTARSMPACLVQGRAMWDHYHHRTLVHVSSVQRYCFALAQADRALRTLDLIAMQHDADKFEEPNLTPYIWLTWRYRAQQAGEPFQYAPGMEEAVRAATERHVRANAHHPEYWSPQAGELTNAQDRDAPPAQIVDATTMPDLALAEMVADWCAVAAERGNTPRAWADANVGVRWRFTDAQRERIYRWIDVAWAG